MIIKDNQFYDNIGTHGGAISINSPNNQWRNKATLVIDNNSFYRNMAYFSGNAVYIRLTRNRDLIDSVCGGGVLLTSNHFENNIGTKIHNGGAVSIVCADYDISKKLQNDYFATSAIPSYL